LDPHRASISNRFGQVMELQQQVGQAREQAQAHQQSAQVEQERLVKEKQQLHQAVARAEKEKEELRGQVTQMCTTHMPELKMQLEARKEEVESVQEEKEQLRMRATELCTVYIPTLKKRLDAAEKERDGVCSVVAEMKAELAAAAELQSSARAAEAKAARMAQDLQAAQERADSLARKIEADTQSRAALNEERGQLQAELVRLQSARHSAEAEHKLRLGDAAEQARIAANLQQLEVDKAARATEAASQAECAALSTELQEEKDRVIQLTKITDDVQVVLASSDARAAEAESRAAELVALIEATAAQAATEEVALHAQYESSLEGHMEDRQVEQDKLVSAKAEAASLRKVRPVLQGGKLPRGCQCWIHHEAHGHFAVVLWLCRLLTVRRCHHPRHRHCWRPRLRWSKRWWSTGITSIQLPCGSKSTMSS
jgi:chromosome segregation ATPase